MRFTPAPSGTPDTNSTHVFVSDLAVRRILNVPSIECAISRMRLTYVASLAASNLDALKGMLSMRVPTTASGRLPWIDKLFVDFHDFFCFYPFKLSELGDPKQHAEGWGVDPP